MKLPRRRPRYADVVATLALFLALGGTAYAVTQIDPDSVYTDAIQDQAVTVTKLHKNAVNSSKVLNNSISLDDLVGADVNGSISFSLGANTCGTLSFGVSGAQVGEGVLLTYTGTVAMPAGVVLAPARVTAANTISARACNVTSSAMSVSGIGMRFITFG